jgi:predicted dehydrogenase
MRPVSVAVFGCGQHARAWHLKEYASLPDVEIAAVVDAEPDRARSAAEEFGAPRWFTDHREALEQTSPDLVSIVSPPAYHHRQALDAFEAGAHVLCEKPLALSATEAREMTAAAANAGRFLSMGLQNRHLHAAKHLRRFVSEERLGEVFFTRVWCGHQMQIPGWGHFHRGAQAGGGVVMATAVHFLDCALWVLGNPTPVSVDAFTYRKVARMREPAVTWEGGVEQFDVEDFAHAVIRFENGARMSLEADWLMHPTPRPFGIEYVGTDGRASLLPLRIEVEHGADVEDLTPELEENPDPVGAFLREAVECARTGASPIVQPHEMLHVQAVMDAVYESARTASTAPVRL